MTQQSIMMTMDRLADLPAISLPQGYDIGSFRAGNERDWEEIISESFEKPYDFTKSMVHEEQYLPERVFFVRYEERPVATATAWFLSKYGEDTGCLHMVGILSAHAGKGLGGQVSLAALHRMRQEGRSKAMLNTGTLRLPAIKTYLKLGFVPKIVDESHVERWQTVAETLNDKQLLQLLDRN